MKKYKIYHNPKCSKSRNALDTLMSDGRTIEVIEYIKRGLKKKDVHQLIDMLGEQWLNMVRTKEDDFKENPFDITNREEVVDGLNLHPRLLERPIVIKEKSAIIARDPEKLQSFIE